MRWLLAVTWLLSISPGQTPGTAVDASAVKAGAPQTVAELLNQVPIPSLMFSWAPVGSGAMAYTDRGVGRLMLMATVSRG